MKPRAGASVPPTVAVPPAAAALPRPGPVGRKESRTSDTKEIWKPVPGWDGYEVSSLGRVRSVDRVLSDGRQAGSVTLSQTPNSHGYLQVTLSDGWRTRRFAVHRLVKLAHTGPPRGRQVRHLDGDKNNNKLSNLKYGTQKDNERDKWRTWEKRRKRKKRGEEKGREKETERDRKQVETLPGHLELFHPPVSGTDGLVGLAEAVRAGILPMHLAAVRTARHRDPSFPVPVATQGVCYLYDRRELAAWYATRSAITWLDR